MDFLDVTDSLYFLAGENSIRGSYTSGHFI